MSSNSFHTLTADQTRVRICTFKGAVFCKVYSRRGDKKCRKRCRGWNFKELQYCATNSGPPEVELRFCPWIILFKYWTCRPDLGSSLCPYYVYMHRGGRPKVSLRTGPQIKYIHALRMTKNSASGKTGKAVPWPALFNENEGIQKIFYSASVSALSLYNIVQYIICLTKERKYKTQMSCEVCHG